MKKLCPGSSEIRAPYPEELICLFCHTENEIWSDEPDTICKGCGMIITRDMKSSCIRWCPSARECIGSEKYDTLIKKLTEKGN